MKTRFFELGRDYPDICEWWRARGWPHLPVPSLPANGLIVENDAGTKICAVFWYLGEADWACLDYLVTNPAAPLRERPKAIELIVETALKEIVALKASFGFDTRVFTFLNNENLIEIFARHGFQVGDKKMTTLVYVKGIDA